MLFSLAARTPIRIRLSVSDREEMFPNDLVNIGHTLEVATILSDLSKLTTTLDQGLSAGGNLSKSREARSPPPNY